MLSASITSCCSRQATPQCIHTDLRFCATAARATAVPPQTCCAPHLSTSPAPFAGCKACAALHLRTAAAADRLVVAAATTADRARLRRSLVVAGVVRPGHFRVQAAYAAPADQIKQVCGTGKGVVRLYVSPSQVLAPPASLQTTQIFLGRETGGRSLQLAGCRAGHMLHTSSNAGRSMSPKQSGMRTRAGRKESETVCPSRVHLPLRHYTSHQACSPCSR